MQIAFMASRPQTAGPGVSFGGVGQRLARAAEQEYRQSLETADLLYGVPRYRVHGERFSAKDVAAYVQESWNALEPWGWLAAMLGGGVRAGHLFERFGDRSELTLDLVRMKKAGLIDVEYSYSDIPPALGTGHGYTIQAEKPVRVTPKGRDWLAATGKNPAFA